ncbi:MAG: acyltransferase family protein [Clostridia bacterium]|nr:acyltransferase family protein [Clostridia bacterium]
MKEVNCQKTRLIWLDVLKGILIIFVVLSHSYPPQVYRNFFTPFFLTMFFWVSGYTFSTKNNFGEFFMNKCKRLLIPFIILGSTRVVVTFVLEGGNAVQRVKGLLLQINCQYDEMWFVACLFTSSLLFYVICKISAQCGKWHNIIILLVSAGCLVISMIDICIWEIRFPWQIEIAGMMVFYMALGYLHRKYEKMLQKYSTNSAYIGCFSIVYCGIVFILPNTADIHSESFENPFLFMTSSIIVILPMIYIAQKAAESKWAGIFKFWGQNTLFYYAFGGSIRIVLYLFFEMDKIGNTYLASILCTALTMVLLILPAAIAKKYFAWAVGG